MHPLAKLLEAALFAASRPLTVEELGSLDPTVPEEAILTALNITDEFFRTRSALNANSGTLTARAEAIEKIVDQALALAE